MNSHKSIACYITAGGKAKRMNGKLKAFIEIDGERIIDKNLRIYKSLFSEIGIITNDVDKFIDYKNNGIHIISDKYKDIGPIAGIHSSIENTEADYVFIAASDMPKVSAKLIKEMVSRIDNFDAIIPIHNKNIEPLFAVYSSNILEKLIVFIEKGDTYAIRSFLEYIKVNYYEVPMDILKEDPFQNINYESDL